MRDVNGVNGGAVNGEGVGVNGEGVYEIMEKSEEYIK